MAYQGLNLHKLLEEKCLEEVEQIVFDFVVAHLRKQGAPAKAPAAPPAYDDDGNEIVTELVDECRYRGDNGTACAVGCLIPDEKYDPSIEGDTVYDLSRDLIPDQLIGLLEALQLLHDTYDPDQWERQFYWLAKRYNLTHTPPEDQKDGG